MALCSTYDSPRTANTLHSSMGDSPQIHSSMGASAMDAALPLLTVAFSAAAPLPLLLTDGRRLELPTRCAAADALMLTDGG